jgi:hypothetical protein
VLIRALPEDAMFWRVLDRERERRETDRAGGKLGKIRAFFGQLSTA